nr:hypothetical protein Iba_scaffold3049CG1590 [Ipomoea batatas]
MKDQTYNSQTDYKLTTVLDCRTLGRLGRSRKGVTGVGVKRRIVETATIEVEIILIQIGSGFANSTTAANCQISQLPSKDYECLVLDVDFQK